MSDELAKRAIACKGWRWMPGMIALDQDGIKARVLDVQAGGQVRALICHDGWNGSPVTVCSPHLPDLEDPATLGCLLALVREAWAPATWITTTACLTSGGVHGWRVQGLDLPMQSTEAEALVAALEGAP